MPACLHRPALAVLLLLIACGGESATAPPPTGIGAAGGTVTGPAGARVVVPAGALQSTTAIAVTQDANGAPAVPAGLTLAGEVFAFTPHGTTFSQPVAVTVPFDAARLVAGRTPVVLQASPGGSWTTLPAPTIAGGTATVSVTSFSFFTVASAARFISVVSGNAQTGAANTALGAPLVVRVSNAVTQLPEPGVVVSFTVSTGGGSVASATATTNAEGLASTTWTLGSAAAPTVTATAPGVTTPAVLTATLATAPEITTTSLAAGTVGIPYTATLGVAGGVGTATWSVSLGSLPAGLALSTTTGIISGTPTLPGTSTFTVQVTRSGQSATRALTLLINAPPIEERTLTVVSGNAQSGAAGAVLGSPLVVRVRTAATQLPVAGAVVTYAVSAGGGSVASASVSTNTDGVASTTWTLGASGPQTVSVTAIGAAQPVVFTATLLTALQISPTSLPAGTVGIPYTGTFTVTGGEGTPTWSISAGSLPNGLTLSSTSGVLSGTPTQTGTSSFTVQVVRGTQTATRAITLLINPPAFDLQITTASLPNAIALAPYSFQLQSNGVPPLTWSSSFLPPGLTLSATGLLSGTPTTEVAPAAQITFRVNNGAQEATRQLGLIVGFRLQIFESEIGINLPDLREAPSGFAINRQLMATGGTGGPYTWTLVSGTLPPNVQLTSTGRLSGQLTVQGAATPTIVVRVFDGLTTIERTLTMVYRCCFF